MFIKDKTIILKRMTVSIPMKHLEYTDIVFAFPYIVFMIETNANIVKGNHFHQMRMQHGHDHKLRQQKSQWKKFRISISITLELVKDH